MRIGQILTFAAMPVLVSIASCGLEPYDPRPPQEIPDGPGLFTGPEGVFMLAAPRAGRERQPSRSTGAPATTSETPGSDR